MNHEQAYQLTLKFARAGREGWPMPVIEDEAHRATLTKLYMAGRKAGHHPAIK